MNTKAVVLIVDDEQTNIDIVSKILDSKYDLRVAHNGKRALSAIEKIEIDLILLDIQMPEMDGFEVAKTIRKEKKYDHIPIIFLTSQNNEDSVVGGFDVGGNDYITKPFNPKELLARVATHLHVHQLQKFLEMILNSQSTIIAVTDGSDLKFINKSGLNFFHCKSSSEFLKIHKCVCETFEVDENYFYHLEDSKESWIEEIQKLPQQDRNVLIKPRDGEEKVFHIQFKSVPGSSLYTIDFNDISETIQQQKQLENKALHDNLTGAYNRSYFDENVEKLSKRAPNLNEIKVVAFLDIDYFKKVNDTYGHAVGDNVLKEFVAVLEKCSRRSDTLIRWGGEEFILLFTLFEEDSIDTMLNKFKTSIDEYSFKTVGHLTCSIGATILHDDETLHTAIKRADEALYLSKAAGRNRITLL